MIKCDHDDDVMFSSSQAVSLGRVEPANLLLEGGANCGSRTGPPHKTPLHLAAAGGNIEIMMMLVRRGANWKVRLTNFLRTL